MKAGRVQRHNLSGITLVESLVVIVVIVVLAGMLLPALSGRSEPKISVVRMDLANLAAAIGQYHAVYDRFPLQESATNLDLTLGIAPDHLLGFKPVTGTSLAPTNSDLIAVLLAADFGLNAGHKLNPQKLVFLNAKMVGDAKSPGVSTVDRHYRDPWGNPYIISLDADSDGWVRDACYSQPSVSSNTMSACLTNRSGHFELNGPVMIWSRGPDGKADATIPANVGVNKDNVLSWK